MNIGEALTFHEGSSKRLFCALGVFFLVLKLHRSGIVYVFYLFIITEG